MNRRDLLHVRQWQDGSEAGYLALDLVGGDRVFPLVGKSTIPDGLPDPVMVCTSEGSGARLTGQGLLVSEDVFWSLLDPLQPMAFAEPRAQDALSAEKELRDLALRFWDRVRWWQSLPADAPAQVRRLLGGQNPDLNPLLDLFDTLDLPESGHPETGTATPLLPISDSPPDVSSMHGFFLAEDGLGALYGQHFLPRYEQAEMGREVAAALDGNQALMIEAGTGVGKTLAYLIPLVAAIRHQECRVVVSTHTRALQSQILDQDLPRLQPLLQDQRFNLLMGRNNYLCLRQRLAFFSRPVENLEQAVTAAAFHLWLQVTRDGLREELTHHPLLGPQLDSIFFRSDLCLPGQCYSGNKCFVQKARQRARESSLLVVNHSLLMQDFKSGHTLLGEYDHLVVDEAHRLPAVALDSHAVVCGLWRLDEVADLLGRQSRRKNRLELLDSLVVRLGALGPDGEQAASAVGDFSRVVRQGFSSFRTWWQGLGQRVDDALPKGLQRQGRARVRDKGEAFGVLRPLTAELLEALSSAEIVLSRVKRATEKLEDLSSGLEDDLAQMVAAGKLLGNLHQDVHFLVQQEDEDWVTWLEPSPDKGLRNLGATLLEAGGILRDYWSDCSFAPIVTSATLAVGEDFSHLMGELGLTRRHPSCLTSTCPSPFDFDRQLRILTPRNFPAPGAPDFGQAVGEVMKVLGMRAPYKTLGLYTSYRMIRETREVLADAGLTEDERTTCGPVVLAQGPGNSASALVGRFRRHRRAMLLGTATFWEGVDFPGRDLEILVVTKLPFLVPNDPWVEARCEKVASQGENPFTRFMVRDAVLRLRQGVGRLIRRLGDRGVVIILDNRLHTKNYGVTFLSALPAVPTSFGDAEDLLERVDKFLL